MHQHKPTPRERSRSIWSAWATYNRTEALIEKDEFDQGSRIEIFDPHLHHLAEQAACMAAVRGTESIGHALVDHLTATDYRSSASDGDPLHLERGYRHEDTEINRARVACELAGLQYTPETAAIVLQGITVPTATPLSLSEPNLVTPGELWEARAPKHRGMRLQVMHTGHNAITVWVVAGGASQNSRKAKHRPWHIKRKVFLTHYHKVSDAPRTVVHADETQQPIPPRLPMSEPKPTATPTVIPPDPVLEHYLDYIVRMLERWGGAPVKEYVLTQYGPRYMPYRGQQVRTNKAAISALVAYGQARGRLVAWNVSPDPHRPNLQVSMVGLPGGPREPLNPDGTYPGSRTTQVTMRILPARATERTYSALSETEKDEIQRLLRLGESETEIQRAYNVMLVTIRRLKRDIERAQRPTRAPDAQPAPARRQQPTPTISDPATSQSTLRADLEESLRNRILSAPPLVTTPRVEQDGTGTFAITVLEEHTLTITADSKEEAIRHAQARQHVAEVLSIKRLTLPTTHEQPHPEGQSA